MVLVYKPYLDFIHLEAIQCNYTFLDTEKKLISEAMERIYMKQKKNRKCSKYFQSTGAIFFGGKGVGRGI